MQLDIYKIKKDIYNIINIVIKEDHKLWLSVALNTRLISYFSEISIIRETTCNVKKVKDKFIISFRILDNSEYVIEYNMRKEKLKYLLN